MFKPGHGSLSFQACRLLFVAETIAAFNDEGPLVPGGVVGGRRMYGFLKGMVVGAREAPPAATPTASAGEVEIIWDASSANPFTDAPTVTTPQPTMVVWTTRQVTHSGGQAGVQAVPVCTKESVASLTRAPLLWMLGLGALALIILPLWKTYILPKLHGLSAVHQDTPKAGPAGFTRLAGAGDVPAITVVPPPAEVLAYWGPDKYYRPNRPAVTFEDPRSDIERKQVQIVAFHFPGRQEACDHFFGATFLASCYEFGPEAVYIEPPAALEVGGPTFMSFSNAMAAFQALKFWTWAKDFSALSGEQAIRKSQDLKGQEDEQYAGYGSAWRAMLVVLLAKFEGNELSDALLKTDDAFLLDHAGERGDLPAHSSDSEWSDGADGQGLNLLGLQLMLVRDWKSGKSEWTPFIEDLLDVHVGKPHYTVTELRWRSTVHLAYTQVTEAISQKAWH